MVVVIVVVVSGNVEVVVVVLVDVLVVVVVVVVGVVCSSIVKVCSVHCELLNVKHPDSLVVFVAKSIPSFLIV